MLQQSVKIVLNTCLLYSDLVHYDTFVNHITAVSFVAALVQPGRNGVAIPDKHTCPYSLVVLLVVTAARVLMSKRTKWAEVVSASFINSAVIPVNIPPG